MNSIHSWANLYNGYVCLNCGKKSKYAYKRIEKCSYEVSFKSKFHNLKTHKLEFIRSVSSSKVFLACKACSLMSNRIDYMIEVRHNRIDDILLMKLIYIENFTNFDLKFTCKTRINNAASDLIKSVLDE